MFEFEEFKREVISTYRDMLLRHELDIKLENPTPGNLRNISLKLYANGLSKEDIQVFQDFFNPTRKYDDLEMSIRRFELDKLKPLKNFILAKTSKPDENIVKLLAILTQFSPRPFHKWRELRRYKQTTLNHQLDSLENNDPKINKEEKYDTESNLKKEILEDGKIRIDGLKNEEAQQAQDHLTEKQVTQRPEESIKEHRFTEGIIGNIDHKHPYSKLEHQERHIKEKNLANSKQGKIRRKPIFYLPLFTSCLALLCMATYLLTLKLRLSWIEVQYVTTEYPHYGKHSEIITLSQDQFSHIKKIVTPIYTIATLDSNQVTLPKTSNSTALFKSSYHIAFQDSVQPTIPCVILLYAGEEHSKMSILKKYRSD